jgi:hypothetical protein
MDKKLRRVEVIMKSSKRGVSIGVFAEKDPIRAAKRFVRQMGFNTVDFEWANAKVLEGPDPNPPPELEVFEEDLLLRMLTGEIETRRVV